MKSPQSLLSLFEANVSLLPREVAVVDETGSATYRQLADDVSATSDALRPLELEQEVVAILVPSCGLYVVSVLAVAALRGIFAPLDEAWPDKRIAAALRVVRPRAMIVTAAQRSRAEALIAELDHPCIIAVIERDARSLRLAFPAGTVVASGSKPALPAQHWRDDSLYIAFTSGSTGVPNAVEGCHGSLAHFIRWQAKAYSVDEGSRVAQLAPTTFDVSLRDIFLPLATGGAVFIPTARTKYHPMLLAQWIARHRITIMHSVPSLFKFVAGIASSHSALKGSFKSLEKLFLSGEALRTDDAKFIYQPLGDRAQIVNLYGPTECTLIKTHYAVPRNCEGISSHFVPIGFPIDDCSVVIERADGVEGGEIVLQSPHLAKGYYRNPELTAQKFSELPDAPGWRRLRTGDAGFLDEDGCLHFLGRLDDQVKINGNRVELGDIEHCAKTCDGIEDAVAVAYGDGNGGLTLACAYVSKTGVHSELLRSHFRQHLPAHMVPSRVAAMDNLPLNRNGKLDRRRLAELFVDRTY